MKRIAAGSILAIGISGLCLALGFGGVAALASPLAPAGNVVGARSLASTPACARWNVVASPDGPGMPVNDLWGVAAVSSSNVWAVGHQSSGRESGQPLIEHWDGLSWQVVAGPNPSTMDATLYGVSAVSPSDIWAVGDYVSTIGVTQTLIEHWDGQTWQVVASPSPDSANNELFSVSAAASDDVWAVGFRTPAVHASQSPIDETLVEHWNGSRWSVVNSADPYTGGNHLEGVAAVSAGDVWAVGFGVASGQPLIEHWNGSHWSAVVSPAMTAELHAVSADAANDVWAVGENDSNAAQTLVEHWNGTNWTVVSSPNTGNSDALYAVDAISPAMVWGVGSDFTSNGVFQPLAMRWDGATWSLASVPSPSADNTQLIGVAALSANDVWAVGHAAGNTLVEHYSCPSTHA